ncbi:MAG TPA: hypothetical protein DCR93_20020 [Cytophagales bacterium]|nr:hypothetical protein [Cytophagales bacterium]
MQLRPFPGGGPALLALVFLLLILPMKVSGFGVSVCNSGILIPRDSSCFSENPFIIRLEDALHTEASTGSVLSQLLAQQALWQRALYLLNLANRHQPLSPKEFYFLRLHHAPYAGALLNLFDLYLQTGDAGWKEEALAVVNQAHGVEVGQYTERMLAITRQDPTALWWETFEAPDSWLVVYARHGQWGWYTVPKSIELGSLIDGAYAETHNARQLWQADRDGNADRARVMHRLYRVFLEPALADETPQRLYAVAQGTWSQLPLSALVTHWDQNGQPVYLAQQTEIHYPGVGASTGSFRAEGVTALAPYAEGTSLRDAALLPFTAIETKTYPGATVLTPQRSTFAAFCRSLTTESVVHVGTHGLARDQPWLKFFGEEGASELVHSQDLTELKVVSPLVVLAACESGHVGSEGQRSMSQALSAAGAKQVLSHLTYLEEQAGCALMQGFYSALAEGEVPSTAMHSAQRNYLKSADEHHRNPYYWSGWQLHTQGAAVAPFRLEAHAQWSWGLGILCWLLLWWIIARRGTVRPV